MNFLGKLAVLLQTALSLLFLTVAFGIYSQRINYPTISTDTGKVIGIVETLQDELKKSVEPRNVADSRFFAARKQLAALEAERPGRLGWYKDTLSGIATGKSVDGTEMTPAVTELEKEDPATRLIPLKRDTAYTIRGKPALSLQGYDDEMKKAAAEVKAQQERTIRLIADEKRLTVEINGGTYTVQENGEDKDVTVAKGLRRLLGEQEEFAGHSRDEQEALLPQLANRWAEAQLQLKRKATLEARREELVGGSAAGGR
jgi:hypothetical protein